MRQADDYFNNFTRSTIEFPAYNGSHEGSCLNGVADGENIFLMGQKFIKLQEATSKFEFCNLLTSDNCIVHVKKYSSSSVLSHLFSQAYVSAESLLRNSEVVEQVNEHLSDMTTHRFKFDPSEQPRNAKIILAIMQKDQVIFTCRFLVKSILNNTHNDYSIWAMLWN